MATKELSGAPGTGALLAKAVLGALPLPGRSRRRGAGLPDTELVLPEVRVDADHLAGYARVCGFGVRDELPPTYPHVLAFPLAMQLMTDRAFPFPMIGLVHVANTITVARPLRLDEPFALRVRVVDLRPHERGRQFDVIQEATAGGEPVWRDVSTYLRRGGPSGPSGGPSGGSSGGPTGGPSGRSTGGVSAAGGGSGGPRPQARSADGRPADPPLQAPAAVWRVGEDIGRRYAAVSGDRNPIHLHAFAARAFGFPRAIAHGMWTKARCIAALEGRLPAAYTVTVAFKLPVLLPAKVAFGAENAGDLGWRFTLRDARSGRPHLAGTVTPG